MCADAVKAFAFVSVPFSAFIILQIMVGKASIGLGRTVNRQDNPRGFWHNIAAQILVMMALAYLLARGQCN